MLTGEKQFSAELRLLGLLFIYAIYIRDRQYLNDKCS